MMDLELKKGDESSRHEVIKNSCNAEVPRKGNEEFSGSPASENNDVVEVTKNQEEKHLTETFQPAKSKLDRVLDVCEPEKKKKKIESPSEEFEVFRERIQDACKSAPDIVPSIGIICGCLFSNQWYRAKIISVEPEIRVHYLDVGCTTWYHAGLFKELPDEIASEPPNEWYIGIGKPPSQREVSEVPEKEENIPKSILGDSYFSTDFLAPEMPLVPFYNSYKDRLKTFETVKNLYHYKEETVISVAQNGFCYGGHEGFLGYDVASDIVCYFCGNNSFICNEVELSKRHYEGCKFAKEEGERIRFFPNKKMHYCPVCNTNPYEVNVYPCGHGTCIKCAKKLGNKCPVCNKLYTGLKVRRVRGLIP